MKKLNLITEIESLMDFQERVLHNGSPSNGQTYTTEMLEKELMFNDIFLKNTDEMFTKYDCYNVRGDYGKLLDKYVKNVKYICNELFKINSDYSFSRKSSFERRLAGELNLRGRLSISRVHEYHFTDGIYFIFKSINPKLNTSPLFYDIANNLMVAKFDNSVFEKPFRDGKTFWKTDDCIIEYLQNEYNTDDVVEVKITTKGDYIMKIEFYRSDDIYTIEDCYSKAEMMNEFIKYLSSENRFWKDDIYPFILENQFLFIDDIKAMCKEMNKSNTKIDKQTLPFIDLNNLTDDILVEYPLDSFDSYLKFLYMAANNKETKSISLTLYRVGFNPSIYNILKQAKQNGIDVNVNIELCASGEWINTFLFEEMLELGINATAYKESVMKVHSKLTLVEFKNGKSIAQIGTGNYHTETTLQYTDLSLITADNEICNSVKDVFNLFSKTLEDEELEPSNDLIVTGISKTNIDLLLDLIDEQAELGKEGYICFKCNSLSSRLIIRKLNDAASKGCKIDLIIRGICTWIPNYSNVTVQSIVWDKLEHSRVYSFGKTNPTIYIGSLDLVDHKIMHRIETLVKIKTPKILVQLTQYLNRYLTNNSNTWFMNNGTGIYYIKED